jgi:transposase-like protein
MPDKSDNDYKDIFKVQPPPVRTMRSSNDNTPPYYYKWESIKDFHGGTKRSLSIERVRVHDTFNDNIKELIGANSMGQVVKPSTSTRHKAADYKLAAVRSHIVDGKSVADVCDFFKCTPRSLGRWITQHTAEGLVARKAQASMGQVVEPPTNSNHRAGDYKLAAVRSHVIDGRSVADVCDFFKCTPRSLGRWVTRYTSEGTVARKESTAVAYKVTPSQHKYIMKQVKKHPDIAMPKLHAELKKKYPGFDVTTRHLLRIVNKG